MELTEKDGICSKGYMGERAGGDSMDAFDKWFGKPAYPPAMKALQAAISEMENLSYRQIEDITDCMKDFAKESCLLTVQK